MTIYAYQPTDRELLKQVQVGLAASAGSVKDISGGTAFDPVTAVAESNRRSFKAEFTDGGTAATENAEAVIFRLPVRCKLISCYVTVPVAVTANDTNYKTLTLSQRTAAAPATAVAIAAQTTKITGGSGDIAQWASAALTVDATKAQLNAGDCITFKCLKTSSGVALAASGLNYVVTVVVEEN